MSKSVSIEHEEISEEEKAERRRKLAEAAEQRAKRFNQVKFYSRICILCGLIYASITGRRW